jgi:hypothetical protein
MRKRLLPIVAVLLLAIPLAYLLQGLSRQVFLIQVLRFAWTIRALFESLPQTTVWIAFLVIALLIAVRSLIKRRMPGRPESGMEAAQPGQVFVMARRVQRSSELAYSRRSLARDMRALALEVLAYQRRTTSEQMRRELSARRLDVPPEIQAYLNIEQVPIQPRSATLFSRLVRRLSPRARAPQIDPELERVVQFLESQLGIGPQPQDRPHIGGSP